MCSLFPADSFPLFLAAPTDALSSPPHTPARMYSDTLEEKCSLARPASGRTTAIAGDVKRTRGHTRGERATTISPHNRTVCGKGRRGRKRRGSRGGGGVFATVGADRSAGHSNTRVPGLAFYGAIRARWCVIMAPYRGKAISVRRPARCAPGSRPPFSSLCPSVLFVPRRLRHTADTSIFAS